MGLEKGVFTRRPYVELRGLSTRLECADQVGEARNKLLARTYDVGRQRHLGLFGVRSDVKIISSSIGGGGVIDDRDEGSYVFSTRTCIIASGNDLER